MQPSKLQQHIDTLALWIAKSQHLVVFTGAGISTDSGIPDYRGPDGDGRGATGGCRRRSGA